MGWIVVVGRIAVTAPVTKNISLSNEICVRPCLSNLRLAQFLVGGSE